MTSPPAPDADPRPDVDRGLRLHRAGDPASAARVLQAADRERPLAGPALLVLARSLARCEPAAASALLPRLLEHHSLRRGAGRLATSLGAWDVAASVWRDLDPDQLDLEARFHLAQVAAGRGRPEADADSDVAEIEAPAAARRLADAFAHEACGELAAASQAFAEALAMAPGEDARRGLERTRTALATAAARERG